MLHRRSPEMRVAINPARMKQIKHANVSGGDGHTWVRRGDSAVAPGSWSDVSLVPTAVTTAEVAAPVPVAE